MRAWARRTAELRGELAAIADPDPRWWLLAGGAAATERRTPRAAYIVSDGEPSADTFIGYRAPRAGRFADPFAAAIARAQAARQTLRELDGTLPDQPLCVTVDRSAAAVIAPSDLAVAAFAIGDRVLLGRLDDPQLATKLRHGDSSTGTPFVCVSLGDDPMAVARHAHRRAWTARGGPWLGLGHTGELATVSTCHFVVDGYGHARIAARIAELTRAPSNGHAANGYVAHGHTSNGQPSTGHAANGYVAHGHTSNGQPSHGQPSNGQPSHGQPSNGHHPLPSLAPVRDAIPLGVAWRALPHPAPRAIPMAYALGIVLDRRARRSDVTGHPPRPRFSPTFQIPVAPGDREDATRWSRRVVPALVSVRFDASGQPEPFEIFAARVRDALAREAQGRGLCSRLLAAARGAPAPLAWKRRSASPSRPRWLERFADVIGGRACLSRIHVDAAMPLACAVSSPARLPTADDPLGGCVITVVDDGTRAAITACGAGRLGDAEPVLDELLALL